MTKMMKRVCNRPIQIGALTMCYSVVTPYHCEQLCKLDYGECYEMQEFRLYHTDGRYFDNIYIIRLFDEILLKDIFFHYLNRVISFKCKDKSVCWLNILGRRKVIPLQNMLQSINFLL